MSLTVGEKIEDYELIACLKPRLQHTWLARGTDGKEYVLRFLGFYGISPTKPPRDFASQQSLNIEGYVPFTAWKYVKIGKYFAWMLVRPYFAQRLSERFEPSAKASSALLDNLASYAQIFEQLEAAIPDLNFELSSGNLLLDGDKPVLVDIEIGRLLLYDDSPSPLCRYVEQERLIPLDAAYPSIYSLYKRGTGTAYKNTIQRTDAQFAIAALYIWLRTRYLLFEDPRKPYPSVYLDNTPIAFNSPEFMAIIQWTLTIPPRVRAYEERGKLDLLMISDAKEREILLKALHRDRAEAYSSPGAFVEALREIV